MRRWFLVCGLFSLAVGTPLKAQNECSPEKLQDATSQVKAAQAQLLAVKAEQMDTNVASSTQERIRAMKNALATFVDQYVGCQQQVTLDTDALGIRLADMMGANTPEHAPPHSTGNLSEQDDQVYGANLKISARRIEAKPPLVAVAASFGVSCGEDTALFVYEWQREKWSRVLRWQSADYSTVSGAFGDFFEYLVVTEGPADNAFVAVAHGKPWCTSRWSTFDLDVIRLPVGSEPQQVALHKETDYDRAADNDIASLTNEPGGFELRVNDMSLDFAVFSKTVIYRYKVTGDRVRRVQPVATTARDFVDVWLESQWPEAADWSMTDNLDNLKNEHSRIESLRGSKMVGTRPTFSFGAVRSCAQESGKLQVELDFRPGAPTYFEIRESQKSFTMLSASNRPDPSCKNLEVIARP